MTKSYVRHPLITRIIDRRGSFTPQGRRLGDYLVENPKKAVFMTTRKLAAASGVSESTIVRFVARLGYKRYGDFLQALRDYVDTEMTLTDRVDLLDMEGPESERFRRLVHEEIDNLKDLFKSFDRTSARAVVEYLKKSQAVYVVGSRLSYTLAYYMGWSLTKLRSNIHIMKGSDKTTLDRLTIAPPPGLVVVIATSRYPNELINIGKAARRLGHTLVVITDSSICPLIPFSHETLVAPSRYFPMIGSPVTLSCLINFLILELAGKNSKKIKIHQERLEQTYRENDILFNLDELAGPDAVD